MSLSPVHPAYPFTGGAVAFVVGAGLLTTGILALLIPSGNLSSYPGLNAWGQGALQFLGEKGSIAVTVVGGGFILGSGGLWIYVVLLLIHAPKKSPSLPSPLKVPSLLARTPHSSPAPPPSPTRPPFPLPGLFSLPPSALAPGAAGSSSLESVVEGDLEIPPGRRCTDMGWISCDLRLADGTVRTHSHPFSSLMVNGELKDYIQYTHNGIRYRARLAHSLSDRCQALDRDFARQRAIREDIRKLERAVGSRDIGFSFAARLVIPDEYYAQVSPPEGGTRIYVDKMDGLGTSAEGAVPTLFTIDDFIVIHLKKGTHQALIVMKRSEQMRELAKVSLCLDYRCEISLDQLELPAQERVVRHLTPEQVKTDLTQRSKENSGESGAFVRGGH